MGISVRRLCRCGWTANFEQLQSKSLGCPNHICCGWTANFEQLQSAYLVIHGLDGCGWTANFEQLQCGVVDRLGSLVADGPRILNSYNYFATEGTMEIVAAGPRSLN
ncbi:MAG: hypothetical protein AAF689_12115, partial [Pseudomonadota bacterium]